MTLAFCACGSSDKPSEEATDEAYAPYWTDEQKATLDSMKQVDDEGYLYEMDYSAEYNLDDIIAEGTKTSPEERAAFQKLYLSESEFDVPEKIYGSCTGFATKDADGHQIMGRNYDWDKDEQVGAVVHIAPKDGYKSVGMTDMGFIGVAKGFNTIEEKECALYAPLFTVDGMNETGLACTVLVLEEDGSKQETGKKTMISGMVVRMLLDRASTVQEAEELLRNYDIVSSMYASREDNELGGSDFHWLVTDKNGDSAIFEIVDNKLVVNKTPVVVEGDIEGFDSMPTADINKNVKIEYPKEDKGYLCVTNFYVSEGYKNTHGEGYWRYQTISKKLEENLNPTTEEAMEYLKDTKYGMNDVDCSVSMRSDGDDPEVESNWPWITVWSGVYNTDDLTLTLCLRENYDKAYTFEVK
ncbi:MAG: linear amide C-N hydrolase [Clostridia bacterium]|nr:linear amide C-N hydrolase [Clostridia bacterium]